VAPPQLEIVLSVSHRRGEAQILIELLMICMNGVRLTHLMYRANLGYSTLRKYLLAMTNQGLITKTSTGNGSRVYYTTQKGRMILKDLNHVKDYLAINSSS
jgi:predicted transcriptional regulator